MSRKTPWKQLVADVAGWSRLEQVQVERALAHFADSVLSAVARGESVRWPAVGTFGPGRRAARVVRNPMTKELMRLQETKTVKFTAAKAAKERVR